MQVGVTKDMSLADAFRVLDDCIELFSYLSVHKALAVYDEVCCKAPMRAICLHKGDASTLIRWNEPCVTEMPVR
jgi:hypothetical protein